MPQSSDLDILLVEDSPVDAEFTLRALRKANLAIRVAHAQDGIEALEYLFGTGAYAQRRGRPPPRLVLLDLNLPRLDGLELLRRLRGDPRMRSMAVVMFTASHDPHDIAESYRAGANSYVHKPAEYADLIAILADVVRYWLHINQVAV